MPNMLYDMSLSLRNFMAMDGKRPISWFSSKFYVSDRRMMM